MSHEHDDWADGDCLKCQRLDEVPMYERDTEPKELEFCEIHSGINQVCECR